MNEIKKNDDFLDGLSSLTLPATTNSSSLISSKNKRPKVGDTFTLELENIEV